MRVAVHQSNGSVFAYRLGDVTEGHHNLNIVTGELTPIHEVLQGLVAQAENEYPDAKVVVEKLQPRVSVAEGSDNDEQEWVSVESPAEGKS